MAEEDDSDKKHEPGEKQLREAAERGQMPRSQDVMAVAAILASGATLTYTAGMYGPPLVAYAMRVVGPDGPDPSTLSGAMGILHEAMLLIAAVALPPLVVAGITTTFMGLAQTQFQLATQAFEWDFEKLNPITGFERHFLSKQPFVELAKGLLHVFALGAITWWAMKNRIHLIPTIASMPASQLLPLMAELAWHLVARAVPILAVIAAADYAWSWWQNHQQLMRTDQQVKDDMKESEGDPRMKAMRRQKARRLSQQNVMQRLKQADVLVTNPTHFAVALRYRRGQDVAPVVVAKGVDHLALRMRQEALRLGIARVEDRPLARALYHEVPSGRTVPTHLFGPVARVLAVVLRKRARLQVRPAAK